MLKNCQEQSFGSDNACEAVAENWSAELDKLDSIQKGNGYKMRTYSVRDNWVMRLMLHMPSICYGHTNVDLMGVWGFKTSTVVLTTGKKISVPQDWEMNHLQKTKLIFTIC